MSNYTVGTSIPNSLHSKWNSGVLNALLGPLALTALLVRGAASTLLAITNHKDTYTNKCIAHHRTPIILSEPDTYIHLIKMRKGISTLWKATVINKLHLFLSSAVGTVAWTAIAYGIATLINGGTSLVLFKAIAAIAIAFAGLSAFPWILGGIVLLCAAIAIVNLYFGCKEKPPLGVDGDQERHPLGWDAENSTDFVTDFVDREKRFSDSQMSTGERPELYPPADDESSVWIGGGSPPDAYGDEQLSHQ